MFEPITISEYRHRTDTCANVYDALYQNALTVVPLRTIQHIHHIAITPLDYLKKLLRNVPLAGDPSVFPYRDAHITIFRVDPHSLKVGQTFVQREKYVRLLELFSQEFDEYCVTRGVAKCNSMVVYGRDKYGDSCLANYVPPILEQHGNMKALLDGMHRSFLIKQVGTTGEAVQLEGVTVPFPASFYDWSDVRITEGKPPVEERFFNLKPELFRNLGWVGIDG